MALRIVAMFLVGLIGQLAIAEENLGKYLDLLKKGTPCEKRSAVLFLHAQGKHAIAALLEHIDDSEIAPHSTLLFTSPELSSILPGSERDQFAGMLYAYVIELIIAKRVLSEPADERCNILLNSSDYKYGRGLITKRQEMISSDDLRTVKQFYLQWWAKNQDKSLAKLRQDWEKGRRPLSGTQYLWR